MEIWTEFVNPDARRFVPGTPLRRLAWFDHIQMRTIPVPGLRPHIQEGAKPMLLMKSVAVKIDQIYVPARLRGSLDPEKVQRLAEEILTDGQQTPIQVRHDGNRYVLVTGLHRLEALRALGETTIDSLIVRPRRR